jgi:hypothetical protein
MRATFMGNPCKNGHDGERYVSAGNCVACEAERRQDPEYRAHEAEYRRRHRQDPAVRAHRAEYQRQRRQDPEYRAKKADPRGDARAAGLDKFQGRPCGHGHGTERYVSGGKCVACVIERGRQHRQTPEARAYQTEYNKQRWQDPEARARAVERKQSRPEIYYQRANEKRRRQYQNDPDYRAYRLERARQCRQDPEVRAHQAELARKRQQSPEVRVKKAAYSRQKYQQDLNYRLAMNFRNRVREAMQTNWKSGHTLELLGCTIAQLRDHLEHQFQPGMCWENHGTVWHVDHCRPCASFDLSDPAQQRECFGFMNLQPLFGVENISKGAKAETEDEEVARYDRYWIAA